MIDQRRVTPLDVAVVLLLVVGLALAWALETILRIKVFG